MFNELNTGEMPRKGCLYEILSKFIRCEMKDSKKCIANNFNPIPSIPGDTLGMEGNVIERRPTTGPQNWFEHKQQSQMNIFVTPPNEAERKMLEAERGESSIGKIVIKDRHESTYQTPPFRNPNQNTNQMKMCSSQ